MILIDAHVHLYDCYSLDSLFNNAYENFKYAAHKSNVNEQYVGVMFLTETRKDNYFQKLKNSIQNPKSLSLTLRDWSILHTQEESSLIAQNVAGNKLVIISGRQIISHEKLEILALGTTSLFDDGRPICDVIDDIEKCGALAVIPWGFGKWIGVRGQIVSNLILNNHNRKIFVGDNSGRLAIMPKPGQLTLAIKQGVAILPGTDPLPLPWEENIVGQFGALLPGRLSLEKPTEQLLQLFLEDSNAIEPYGKLETTINFLRNQTYLRLRKK